MIVERWLVVLIKVLKRDPLFCKHLLEFFTVLKLVLFDLIMHYLHLADVLSVLLYVGTEAIFINPRVRLLVVVRHRHNAPEELSHLHMPCKAVVGKLNCADLGLEFRIPI